jgi:Zn-dependent protease
MLNLLSDPLVFLISAIGLLISLTVHEFAHALVADHLGDPTPRAQGRVSLNPLVHLDPLGTIALLLVGFGWGKPVQFDPYNLENPVRDGALIALAGPAMNLIMAVVFAVLAHVFAGSNLLAFAFGQTSIINVVLAVFNLVPIHPLDGSKIILPLLPKELAYEYEVFMHQYGLFVLLALIFPWYNGMSPISALIEPVIGFLSRFLL